MFRTALVQYAGALSAAPSMPAGRPAPSTAMPVTGAAPAPDGAATAQSHGAIGSEILKAAGRRHAAELEREPDRIERLSSIREIVFGAQDGLVSTFAVVAGLAAAGAANVVVILAGAVSAVAGILSMSIGTFLSSRAQRQLYEAELAREQREIRDHPGEEIAELIAALMARGMARGDAVEVGRRIARHPELLLSTLAVFELGLAPQQHGTPVRDAFIMAAAFGAGSAIPLVPFVIPQVNTALGVAGALTVVALFAVGAIKGRLGHVSAVRSGLEVVVLGIGSGLIGFALGRLASVLLGVDV
jgi:VIT1/CCC1 family predicted Fe2+/Mn2+ transporter